MDRTQRIFALSKDATISVFYRVLDSGSHNHSDLPHLGSSHTILFELLSRLVLTFAHEMKYINNIASLL